MLVLSANPDHPAKKSDHLAHFGIVGESACMQSLAAGLTRIAPADSTVLIEGESGTGKEVIAASLHHHSGRQGRFVAINCGALSPQLLDSELFGHTRGAFTGAAQSHVGVFKQAEGGTLFLDEIGEMPPFLQGKLLRVLESRSLRPVGSDEEQSIDVRLVAATNRQMKQLVADGRFREDLYFRLNVVPLTLPPLRERLEDIAPLAKFFIEHFAKTLAMPAIALSSADLHKLKRHRWPGNVRELRNLIERATLLARSPADCLRLKPLDSATQQLQGLSGYAPQLSLAEVRQRHINQVLHACQGNKSQAARLLGVSRKTLERQTAEE